MEEPIELLQRGRQREVNDQSPSSLQMTVIERKVKPGDTLNKIALQYSVKVAEIKRINNLLSDQDYLARASIKIPVSKLRHDLGYGLESDSDDESEQRIDVEETERLLGKREPREPSVEHLFSKTDANLAQVRESLADETLIPGSFHFLDAQPPKPKHTPIWMLLITVVFVFVILPLFITIYEETEEPQSSDHTHYHNGIQHDTN